MTTSVTGGVSGPTTPKDTQDHAPTAPATSCPPDGQCFADVPSSNPFFDFVNRIYQQDLVTGYPCGGSNEPCDTEHRPYYRPINNVTRQQMAKFIDNARRLPRLDIVGANISPLINSQNMTGTAIAGTSTGTGSGVYGMSVIGNGVMGISAHGDGGFFGSGGTYGVDATTTLTNGVGVRGAADNGEGSVGVLGYSNDGDGVNGTSTHGYGVFGTSITGSAVYGTVHNSNGAVIGINGGDGNGVYGYSANGNGVRGLSSTGDGVYGSTQGSNHSGVTGLHDTPNPGNGVYGRAPTGAGCPSGDCHAGNFVGDVRVTGNLSKGGGSFKIDDPLDPANKYLYHSFVESPDMMNIYNGNVTTDDKGEAVVQLPAYFEALNMDFRYQLTTVGQFAQAIISQEVKDNKFVIKTDKPNVKVSWQVTGIRQDPYANAHRIPVEEEKPADERGKYLHPTEWGQPASMGVDYPQQEIKQPGQN